MTDRKTEFQRDVKFLGSARLLFDDLKPDLALLAKLTDERSIDISEHIIMQRIAQFLYDFACHNAESLDPLHPGTDSAYVAWIAKAVESIPDIPRWPIPLSMWREEKILATDLSEVIEDSPPDSE